MRIFFEGWWQSDGTDAAVLPGSLSAVLNGAVRRRGRPLKEWRTVPFSGGNRNDPERLSSIPNRITISDALREVNRFYVQDCTETRDVEGTRVFGEAWLCFFWGYPIVLRVHTIEKSSIVWDILFPC